MENGKVVPTFIFESSWEVCNKVGGIYTVLSTRAKTLQDAMPDRVVFIGPDFWKGKENPLFEEDILEKFRLLNPKFNMNKLQIIKHMEDYSIQEVFEELDLLN